MKMMVISNIRYSELFQEVMPDNVETILKGIPTQEAVIPYLCLINSLLYNGNNDLNQLNILNVTLPQLDLRTKNILYQRLKAFASIDPKGTVVLPKIFSHNVTFRFITYEIINPRIKDSEDIVKNWDLQLLKAYTWFQLKIAEEIGPVLNDNNLPEQYENEKFQWAAWPVLMNQYEFMSRTDITYKKLKFWLTFDHLKAMGYDDYIQRYLSQKGFKTLEELSVSQTQLAMGMYVRNQTIYQITSDTPEPILESLTINKENFKNDKKKQDDVIGIREAPLYKADDGSYYVMSWGFIDNLFDLSYLFEFHNLSEIKNEFPVFLDFKKYIGDEIMEKLYFRKIIAYYFSKKHIKLEFDEQDKVGFPDAYVRDGNDIYLFEFKDAFMASSTSTSYKFEDIKKDIDLKFIKNKNGKRKGMTQLVNNIKNINRNGFGNDRFTDNFSSFDKLKVFPIIVYTHSLYTTPGINSYLNKKFQDKLAEEFKQGTDFKVYPLVTISLNCLVAHQQYFTEGPKSLKKIIIEYTEKIHDRTKKIIKTSKDNELSKVDMINNEVSAHISLEDEFNHIFTSWTLKKLTMKNYIKFYEYVQNGV